MWCVYSQISVCCVQYYQQPIIAPVVQLNNGNTMPLVGLGTYSVSSTPHLYRANFDHAISFQFGIFYGQSTGSQCEQAVKDAIDAGYRHIDTAFLYGNEKEVGNAIRAKIAEGVIRREDIFVTTKVSIE